MAMCMSKVIGLVVAVRLARRLPPLLGSQELRRPLRAALDQSIQEGRQACNPGETALIAVDEVHHVVYCNFAIDRQRGVIGIGVAVRQAARRRTAPSRHPPGWGYRTLPAPVIRLTQRGAR